MKRGQVAVSLARVYRKKDRFTLSILHRLACAMEGSPTHVEDFAVVKYEKDGKVHGQHDGDKRQKTLLVFLNRESALLVKFRGRIIFPGG